MESKLENGCLSSTLRHTAQRKGEEEEKGGSHLYGKRTYLSCLRIQLMAVQLKFM